MSKPTVDKEGRVRSVIWQEGGDVGIGEPAIVVKYWEGSDLFELKQKENEILVNPETIPDLIKVLRELHKEVTQ